MLLAPTKLRVEHDRDHPIGIADIRRLAVERDSRNIAEFATIPSEDRALAVDQLRQTLELRHAERGLHGGHAILVSDRMAPIHHVARRAAMVAQGQAALIAGLVVEQQNAALAGRERLRPMEAECAEGPEGARRTVFIGGACGLGGVLY